MITDTSPKSSKAMGSDFNDWFWFQGWFWSCFYDCLDDLLLTMILVVVVQGDYSELLICRCVCKNYETHQNCIWYNKVKSDILFSGQENQNQNTYQIWWRFLKRLMFQILNHWPKFFTTCQNQRSCQI